MLIFSRKESLNEYLVPIFFILFAFIAPIIPALLSKYTIDLTNYNDKYHIEITYDMIIVKYNNISNVVLTSNILNIKKRKSLIMDTLRLFFYYFFHYKKPCQLNNPFLNYNTYVIFLNNPIEVENILFDTKYRGFLLLQPIIKKWFLRGREKCDKIIINFSENDYFFLRNLINNK